MSNKSKGWVIINENHPNNPKSKLIYSNTFAYTRKDSIAKFVGGTGVNWSYYYHKYNFRAVKAEIIISI